MCNRKNKNLNNLHKNSKVLPVNRNIGHSLYFSLVYILNLLTRIIIQKTKKLLADVSPYEPNSLASMRKDQNLLLVTKILR